MTTGTETPAGMDTSTSAVVEPQAGAAPAAEPQAAEAGAEPAAPAAAGTTASSAPASAPAAAAPPAQDWRDRRIGQLTARLREAEERAKAATQHVALPAVPPAPSSVPSFTAEAIERRAAELAAQHDFDRRCDEVAISGRTSFPDFDTQVGNLVRLVDRADPASNAAYANFLTAAMETGAAPQLLHDLGQNLNEASRILAMKPVAMGVALAKLASSADTQSPAASTGSVSGAPRPLTPVGGRGSNKELIHPDDTSRADSLSTAEWMARRADQIRARREASRKR